MNKDFQFGKLVFGGLALSLLLATAMTANAVEEPSWFSISAALISVGVATLSAIHARRWWTSF